MLPEDAQGGPVGALLAVARVHSRGQDVVAAAVIPPPGPVGVRAVAGVAVVVIVVCGEALIVVNPVWEDILYISGNKNFFYEG